MEHCVRDPLVSDDTFFSDSGSYLPRRPVQTIAAKSNVAGWQSYVGKVAGMKAANEFGIPRMPVCVQVNAWIIAISKRPFR